LQGHVHLNEFGLVAHETYVVSTRQNLWPKVTSYDNKHQNYVTAHLQMEGIPLMTLNEKGYFITLVL